MSLSVVVMAHPSRKRFVDELLERLGDIPVVWDCGKNDRWDTGRNALLTYDGRADYHLVIQDDGLPCKDLIEGTALAASYAGERPIGLYVGNIARHKQTVRPAVMRAVAQGTPWLEMPGPWWGVGIALPTRHIDELVGWGDRHPEIRNYDRRVAAWYERRDVDCWYTVPSLIEHRPVRENPSLVAGRTSNRQAHVWLGDRSALELDWSLPPVHLRRMTRFRHVRSGLVRKVELDSQRERALDRNPYWVRVNDAAVAA